MCDVKKYEAIYKEIEKLQPEDTLQLILESETDEQRDFYDVRIFLFQKITYRDIRTHKKVWKYGLIADILFILWISEMLGREVNKNENQ